MKIAVGQKQLFVDKQRVPLEAAEGEVVSQKTTSHDEIIQRQNTKITSEALNAQNGILDFNRLIHLLTMNFQGIKKDFCLHRHQKH